MSTAFSLQILWAVSQPGLCRRRDHRPFPRRAEQRCNKIRWVAICDDDREVAFCGLLQQSVALKDLRHPLSSTAGTVAGALDLIGPHTKYRRTTSIGEVERGLRWSKTLTGSSRIGNRRPRTPGRYSDVHHQSLPESLPKEHYIYNNDGCYQRCNIKHDGQVFCHFNRCGNDCRVRVVDRARPYRLSRRDDLVSGGDDCNAGAAPHLNGSDSDGRGACRFRAKSIAVRRATRSRHARDRYQRRR